MSQFIMTIHDKSLCSWLLVGGSSAEVRSAREVLDFAMECSLNHCSMPQVAGVDRELLDRGELYFFVASGSRQTLQKMNSP
jgi:hypothetical protein